MTCRQHGKRARGEIGSEAVVDIKVELGDGLAAQVEEPYKYRIAICIAVDRKSGLTVPSVNPACDVAVNIPGAYPWTYAPNAVMGGADGHAQRANAISPGNSPDHDCPAGKPPTQLQLGLAGHCTATMPVNGG